jgi:hypothetical protein
MPDRREGQQVDSQETKNPRTVLVSEDYLAFLHEELSENQARLGEILGESQAEAIFNWCADKLVRTTKKETHSFHPIDAVVQRLSSWGMEVRLKEMEGKTEIEVQCPYAEHIHPQMSSATPKCPLGEYVLGAVRLEDEKSLLLSNHLTPHGVRFAIQKK